MLFKDYKEGDILRYTCGIDSACLGSTLNPNLIHKQVLARNVSIKVHDLCCDLTSLYPIEVYLYHIRGVRNVSDYNSKLPTDFNPIKLINSEELRIVLAEYTTPDFPPS